jgi:hypothetical protein
MITSLAFALHIGAGAISLVTGMIAGFARKGGAVHRRAGTIFVASMLVMALFAAYLAVVVPDQLVNVFISSLVAYLVLTGWMTVRRPMGNTGRAEKLGLAVALILWAPFAILSFQLAVGLPPLFVSAVPFEGPVLVAIYTFAIILGLAVIGDARLVLAGGISGPRRIVRHLWRMCFALVLATGSAFTNGFSRLLPGPQHVPLAFHLPKLIPFGLLVFWFVRVRFTRWYQASFASGDDARSG